MAYSIDSDQCTNCGICLGECPTEAIFEMDSVHRILANDCIDCGACAGVCPEKCISPE